MDMEGATACPEFMEFQEEEFGEGDCKEEELAVSMSSVADTKFDITIGHIEDIIMEDEFQNMQQAFLEKYYMEFEDTEENKFCYTDIHKEYIDLIERYIENQLKERLPGFSMEDFAKHLEQQKTELEGEVFEILMTFSDFLTFKEMLLDYRSEKEGNTVDLSQGFTVTSLSLTTANTVRPPSLSC